MSIKTTNVVVLGIALLLSVTASAFNMDVYAYDSNKPSSGWSTKLNTGNHTLNCQKANEVLAKTGKLELGQWYTHFDTVKAYADKHGIPMFAIWGNHGCVHCYWTDMTFIQPEIIEWMKTNPTAQVLYCFMANGEKGCPDQKGSAAHLWMRTIDSNTRLKDYPFVVMYWKKKGDSQPTVNWHTIGDTFCRGDAKYNLVLGAASLPERVANTKMLFERYFGDWSPTPDYAGGSLNNNETDDNRLEAESSTKEVSIQLFRSETVSDYATNNNVVVYSPDGEKIRTLKVDWATGETNKTLTIALEGVFSNSDKHGDKAYIVVEDEILGPQGTNTITYITENSVKNPKWLGEEFDFGEWTMDFTAATNKVASTTNAPAYTLVAVTGSLWCPDCANTDRNFLDVEKDGKNRFQEWAKSNNVALVAVDIPNFKSETIECESPTLLSRKAYATRLARPTEFPAAGAKAAETNTTLRSGLGYLTRKGVSDAKAAEVLERNRQLVQKDGLLRFPEDKNSYRTGVPIFVLLRSDGTVAARLTRFDTVSLMAADRAKWDGVINRFDEMIAMAGEEHADDYNNNFYKSTYVGFSADFGKDSGEISHCDFNDVYKLEGMSGGVLQKISLTGDSDARLMVTILDKDGNEVNSASGKLSETVDVEAILPAGNYFVKVSGESITNDDFVVTNPTANNFVKYEVSGSVVIIPTEETATLENYLNRATMRVESNELYRVVGMLETPTIFEATDLANIYRAKASDDIVIKKDDVLEYQLWKPGVVGFQKEKSSVTETIGVVAIPVTRTEGVSGSVEVKVTLNEEKTTLFAINKDMLPVPRWEFATTNLVWAEGENDVKQVLVTIIDDDTFDGAGDVVLTLSKIDGASEVATTEYTLTVKDNDKQSAGKVGFVGAEPFCSKKATVYVREGETATVKADRFEATDGPVAIKVASSKGTLGGAVVDGRIQWLNRDGDEKDVTVTGLTAGQSAMLTLSKPENGVTLVSASNSFTVICVAADALGFANPIVTKQLYRYVANEKMTFAIDGTPAGKVTFSKLSGTLPAGLKADYDADANALAISGTVTAKAGVYTVVYQVKDDSKAGMTQQITFNVADPTSVADGIAPITGGNSSVAKSRTFKDVAFINATTKLLIGTAQVTIPTKGNVSAKLVTANGTKSFSAKNWNGFDAETKEIGVIATNKNGDELIVICNDDGSVELKANIIDDENDYIATISASDLWSKADPATAWQGTYTVVLEPTNQVEATEGIAPRGYGYISMKMTASAAKTGRMTWSGYLPNGSAISGSTTIGNVTGSGDEVWAKLPIFKKSSRDLMAFYLKILADAEELNEPRAVFSADEVEKSVWIHTEAEEIYKADYSVDFNIWGGPYSTTDSLADCCSESYETTNPDLKFDIGSIGDLESVVLAALNPVNVTVTEKAITLPKTKPAGLTLSFSRSTGVVTGSVKLSVDGDPKKAVTAQWKGILLQGWGEGCGCGEVEDGTKFLPFVSGFFLITDNHEYVNENESTKSVSVKRSGVVTIDKVIEVVEQ